MINHVLLAFSAVAVCMDLKRQKIDNGWIFLGWAAGLVYQMLRFGWKGIGLFFLGSVLPILLLYLLFWFRMMGAGDIKMLSVLGGFMGPSAVVVCIGYSLVFGAMLSLAVLILCGNLVPRLRYFTRYLKRIATTKQIVPYMIRGDRMENIHFSVPVFMGVLLFAGGVY